MSFAGHAPLIGVYRDATRNSPEIDGTRKHPSNVAARLSGQASKVATLPLVLTTRHGLTAVTNDRPISRPAPSLPTIRTDARRDLNWCAELGREEPDELENSKRKFS
jgi:hypothetical protein